jgi:hypothetical protein
VELEDAARDHRRGGLKAVPSGRLLLKPDGVLHDRLAVLLLNVVKRQEARIAALEERFF